MVKVIIMGEEKKWYFSKTMWANILLVLGGLATAIGGDLAAGGTVTVAGVVNMVFRVVTETKIKL